MSLTLALDIGNTAVKAAVMSSRDEVLHHWTLEHDGLEHSLKKHLASISAETNLQVGWLSTAGGIALEHWACWDYFLTPPSFFPITALSPMPVTHLYETPQTLGADRITAIVAACSHSDARPVLVIDVGTAITYDVADAAGTYLGGAIAPGLQMRFKALHQFTADLPLISSVPNTPLVGKSTEKSIRSGVINGMKNELEGMLGAYQAQFDQELQVFLTGGDRHLFEKSLKKLNFACSNLVLEGIFLIVQHNLTL